MPLALTSQEKKVLGFLAVMVVLGSLVLAIRKYEKKDGKSVTDLIPTPSVDQNSRFSPGTTWGQVVTPPDLNHSSEEEMAQVPSIGPVFAK